jgi:hypothetical protein
MPITPTNPLKGRHFPGEVILLCVRWYLRYPVWSKYSCGAAVVPE